MSLHPTTTILSRVEMSISGSILYVSSSLIALVALVSITGSAHSIFSSWISNLACFAMGILLIPTVKHVLKQVFNTPWTQMGSENTQANDTNRRIYNLDHARLNLDLPPQSMWMNMGYWKVVHITKGKKGRIN